MNILVGILFVVSSLIIFGAFMIDEDYHIILGIVRSVLSFAALIIMFILGAEIWMYIIGALSVAIHIFLIFRYAFDWDTPFSFVLDVISFFGAFSVGIALFF